MDSFVLVDHMDGFWFPLFATPGEPRFTDENQASIVGVDDGSRTKQARIHIRILSKSSFFCPFIQVKGSITTYKCKH